MREFDALGLLLFFQQRPRRASKNNLFAPLFGRALCERCANTGRSASNYCGVLQNHVLSFLLKANNDLTLLFFMAMQKDQRSLNSTDHHIIEDEQKILQRVAGFLADKLAAAENQPKGKSLQTNYAEELVALRDQVAEARLEDVPALVSQMLQAAALASETRPTVQSLVDHRSPYFGHLRLKEKGRERDVLIGKSGTIERKAGVVIVDWRHAPVSQLYYKHEEGDDYEEYGGEEREGEIVARRMVSIQKGELKRFTALKVIIPLLLKAGAKSM